MEVAAIALASIVLLVWWARSNERHLARREPQAADWDGPDDGLNLWTSQARCVHCGASGGLLEKEGDQLYFACLTCGQRHQRESRG